MDKLTHKFKRFFQVGQKIYYAIHPDRKNLPFNMSDFDRKNNVGKIQELDVVDETAKTLVTKDIVFSKWPEAYFGDRKRGPFSSVTKCQDYLNAPLPVFDHDGNLMNKLSKSSN